MAQGFVIKNNLSESTPGAADSNAINNLAGTGTSNDFLLFDGNTKFISRLYRYEFNVINASNTGSIAAIDNQYTVVVTAEGRVAFSNNTEIALVTGEGAVTDASYNHVVFNSNGIDRFQVRAKADISTTPTQIDISGIDYIQRKDNVTSENLKFMSVKRIPTESESTDGPDDYSDDASYDIYNQLTISQSTNATDNLLKELPFKKERLPLGYESANFTSSVKFDGPITITNTADETVNSTSGPGIFIKNDSAQKKAFIDTTTVPWAAAGDNFITTTKNIAEINDLEINPGNKLITENSGSTLELKASTAANLSAADTSRLIPEFTHKMPITINGEEYFLLMKT